jgi:hypothetical protein
MTRRRRLKDTPMTATSDIPAPSRGRPTTVSEHAPRGEVTVNVARSLVLLPVLAFWLTALPTPLQPIVAAEGHERALSTRHTGALLRHRWHAAHVPPRHQPPRPRPTIGVTTVTPETLSVGQPTTVTITAAITDRTLIERSVSLLRLGPHGKPVHRWRMYDDGRDGDAAPDDRTFSRTIVLSEAAPGTVVFQVSAAFRHGPALALSPRLRVDVQVPPPPPGPPPIVDVADASASISAAITTDGGLLRATAADGTEFDLIVPAGALPETTTITLTPILSISNLPLTGSLLAAAKLEPDGLQLTRPVFLQLRIPDTVPSSPLLGFSYPASGASFHLLPIAIEGDTVTLTLTHFSTNGAASGAQADFLAQIEPMLAALPATMSLNQALSLLDLLTQWFEAFGETLCQGTTVCQTVYDRAVRSLEAAITQTCTNASTAVSAGEPYLAWGHLQQVVQIAIRLADLRSNFHAVFGQFNEVPVEVLDFVCVQPLLVEVVRLAGADGRDNALGVIAGTPPRFRMHAPLLLLQDLAIAAAELGLEGIQGPALAAIRVMLSVRTVRSCALTSARRSKRPRERW